MAIFCESAPLLVSERSEQDTIRSK